jgi:hypothetical protein
VRPTCSGEGSCTRRTSAETAASRTWLVTFSADRHSIGKESQNQHELETPWQTLRWTYGLVPIVAGVDKFTNILVDWTRYTSPLAARVRAAEQGAATARTGNGGRLTRRGNIPRRRGGP